MDYLIDGREMEPPEPFEKTMEAVDRLGDGDRITLLLNCYPHPLFAALRSADLTWSEVPGPDGCFEFHIHKPAPG